MDTAEYTATIQAATTREERGLQLFLDHSGEIWRVEPHVYRVPSCSGDTVYLVVTRRGHEFCPCPDHYYQGGRCKHLVGAHTFRAKSGECADCKGRFLRRGLHEVGDDHLTFFEGEELCPDCAKSAGIR